jgi:hypothetical protein
MTGIIDMSYFCYGCSSLISVTVPTSMTAVTNISQNTGLLGLTTLSVCTFGTNQVNVQFTFIQLTSFNQPTLRVNHLIITGTSLAVPSLISSINIDWANSIISGASPHIDIRWNALSAATLNAIFTALPTVTAKTINVAGNPGSATCTTSIATLKGWTVVIV